MKDDAAQYLLSFELFQIRVWQLLEIAGLTDRSGWIVCIIIETTGEHLDKLPSLLY